MSHICKACSGITTDDSLDFCAECAAKLTSDKPVSSDGLIIDETNFDKYFFDVRVSKLQRGQIIACYSAVAEFVEGNEKKNVIDLLHKEGKAEAAAQVMRKLLCASEKDAVRIPAEIISDLLAGMSYEEVLKKPYKYTFQMYFYTRPEYIPKGDPHWEAISILNSGDSKVYTESELKGSDGKRTTGDTDSKQGDIRS